MRRWAAESLGCSDQSPRIWVKQTEIDIGERDGRACPVGPERGPR